MGDFPYIVALGLWGLGRATLLKPEPHAIYRRGSLLLACFGQSVVLQSEENISFFADRGRLIHPDDVCAASQKGNPPHAAEEPLEIDSIITKWSLSARHVPPHMRSPK